MSDTATPEQHFESYPTILKFLKAYRKWVKDGAIDGSPFDEECGLCDNLSDWLGENEYENDLIIMAVFRDMLRHDMGESNYPFGGHDKFHWEAWDASLHKNKYRMAWVKWKIHWLENHIVD